MDERDDDRSERRGWFGRLHLSWPMLFLAAWLLYEFTAQPGLAALVACAKFGWGDLRTAFWLRRVDPDRPRGQTCFWAHMTYALWKVAFMSTLTMIVLGFFAAILECIRGQPVGKGDVGAMFMGAMAAAGIAVGLSCLANYIALWSALRNGIRIWLGEAPRRAREERFWPPRHGRINAAPFIVFTAVIATLWALIGLMIALVLICEPGAFWFSIILTFTLVIPGLIVLGLRDAAKRLFARAPHECWVAAEEEQVYQASTAEEELSEA